MGKHRLAKTAESYSDYILLLTGGVSFAALIGFIAITIGPDAADGSLFDLAQELFTVGTYSVSLAALAASASSFIAYGTNNAVNDMKQIQESLKTTEGVSFLASAGLPFAYTFSSSVSDWVAGDVMAQGVLLVIYIAALAKVVYE